MKSVMSLMGKAFQYGVILRSFKLPHFSLIFCGAGAEEGAGVVAPSNLEVFSLFFCQSFGYSRSQ